MRWLIEVARVLLALRAVESDRLRTSPQRAATAARRRAAQRSPRSMEARDRLQRAIAFIDRWMPSGPNCLRRSLLEMSLDVSAARERLLAGFKAGGLAGSGHAWLESQAESVTERYDAVIAI